MRPVLAIPACLAAAFIAAIVGAQPPGVTPVIQGYDDVNPLSRSFTVPRADLRVPMDFDRVYRISSDLNLFGRRQEYFARASGGMWAVFPMSTYTQTPAGRIAQVPPGTVWVLGDPTSAARPLPKAPDTRSAAPLDLRIDMSAPPPGPPATPRPDQRTIWTSETYRQERISTLLDQAARHDAAPR